MNRKYLSIFICLMTFFQSHAIQASYIPHQIELQNTIKNYAASINNKGMIAGQLHTVDPITQEELIVDYFWNLTQPEPVVITTEAHEGHFPVINNKGQVAGIIKRKSTSWWQGDEWWQKDTREVYRYDPNKGLTILTKPLGANFGDIHVAAITDAEEVIICDHPILQECTHASVITDDNSVSELWRTPLGAKVFTINRKGYVLAAFEFYAFTYTEPSLYFYNLSPFRFNFLSKTMMPIGIALNERYQAIAKNEEETEGYFWKGPERCVELGNFIPIALNNREEIVGKKEGSFFLRKADASMVDLDSISNEKFEEVTGISDDGHIIGIVDADGQKKVIFFEHIAE